MISPPPTFLEAGGVGGGRNAHTLTWMALWGHVRGGDGHPPQAEESLEAGARAGIMLLYPRSSPKLGCRSFVPLEAGVVSGRRWWFDSAHHGGLHSSCAPLPPFPPLSCWRRTARHWASTPTHGRAAHSAQFNAVYASHAPPHPLSFWRRTTRRWSSTPTRARPTVGGGHARRVARRDQRPRLLRRRRIYVT